jgi:Rrf2 family protein
VAGELNVTAHCFGRKLCSADSQSGSGCGGGEREQPVSSEVWEVTRAANSPNQRSCHSCFLPNGRNRFSGASVPISTRDVIAFAYAAKHPFCHAIEILARLARTNGFKTSDELSEMIGIHPIAVRRVIARLSDAGIIKTQRGFGHGSQLVRSSDSITFGEVYRALNLPSDFVAGSSTGGSLDRLNAQLSAIFTNCHDALEAEFDRLKLASVIESAKQWQVQQDIGFVSARIWAQRLCRLELPVSMRRNAKPPGRCI